MLIIEILKNVIFLESGKKFTIVVEKNHRFCGANPQSLTFFYKSRMLYPQADRRLAKGTSPLQSSEDQFTFKGLKLSLGGLKADRPARRD